MTAKRLLDGYGLSTAAVETLDRIKRDRARSPKAVGEALEVVERHLLDPRFSPPDLYSEVSMPKEHFVEAFRVALDDHPADYIAVARTEIAARMLLESETSIEDIALRSGHANGGSLNHFCHRFFGLAPRELQRRARQAKAMGLEPRFSVDGFSRWRQGRASLEDIETHNACLDHIDRVLGINTVALLAEPWMELGPDFEFQIEPLLDMPASERHALAKRGAIGCSREIFDSLSERSRVLGRLNRQRGVELAELALLLVEGNAERLGSALVDLLALAWARLGNARILAGDLEGAELDIRRAIHQCDCTERPESCKAEALAYLGTLRLFQRRLEESEEILGEAVFWSRVAGDALLEVDALQQRAVALVYLGRPQASIPEHKMALMRMPADDTRRRLVSIQHLLVIHALLENFAEIAELLPDAHRLAAQVAEKPAWLQLRWAEGLLLNQQGDAESAEVLLGEAHSGFAEIGEIGMRAIVALDLALLYDEQNRAPDALKCAAEALPALEALHLPEALQALDLLQRSLAKQAVQPEVLKAARHRLFCPAAPL